MNLFHPACSYKKAVALYALVTAFFFFSIINSFWIIYLKPVVHDLFLFYFNAEYIEFKVWYPKYYFGVYLFVVGVKISLLALVLIAAFALYKSRKRIQELLYYNHTSGLTDYVKVELTIFLTLLTFYLIGYLILKSYPGHNFFDHQQFIARSFLLTFLFQLIVSIVTRTKSILVHIKQYLLTPTLPYTIALFRILFYSYLAFVYLAMYTVALNTVSLPHKSHLPYIGWLIDLIPVNADLYLTSVIAGWICCFFIVIGFCTRFFLIVNALLCFYVVATPNFFGKLWHYQIIIWITWFFTFSKCYDVFSIDALIKKKPVQLSADYTFPIRFIWIQFGVIYFWAGFYKLWDGGFEWALGSSMINQIRLEWAQNYDSVPRFRIDHYPIILHVGGVLAILFEISYPFWAMYPRFRWVAAIGGLIMHNAIGYLMNISFFHFLQVFYAFYLDFNFLFPKKAFKVNQNYSKLCLSFCSFILGMNFLCGMFSVDTYPFSSYPKYSAIIGDRLKILEYRCDRLHKSIFSIGKANGFRWENYGWLEYNLIKDYEEGKNVENRIKDYWTIWKSYNSELRNCDTVVISIKERSLVPEEKDSVYSYRQIGIILNEDVCLINSKTHCHTNRQTPQLQTQINGMQE